ncbi:MAG TPA: BON domain-containing protein [Polyangiaceae bacterium]
MKRFLFTGFVGLALVACGGSNQQAQSPSTTTTTNGTEPIGASPDNNDGTTNLNMHLPPSESEPKSQSQSTPLSTTSQGGGVTGGALSDTTTMSAPNNSSDMTGGGATTASGMGTATGAPSNTSSSDDDRRLTVKIHKALDGSSSLSDSAKNVNVQTAGGNVTLSGVVKSDREKALVEAQVNKIAGAMHVNSQIVVGK